MKNKLLIIFILLVSTITITANTGNLNKVNNDSLAQELSTLDWNTEYQCKKNTCSFSKNKIQITITHHKHQLPEIDRLRNFPVKFHNSKARIEHAISDFINSVKHDRQAIQPVTLKDIDIQFLKYVSMLENLEEKYIGQQLGPLSAINFILESKKNNTLDELKEAFYFYQYISPHLQNVPFQKLNDKNELYMLTRHAAAQLGPGFRTSYSILSRQKFTQIYRSLFRIKHKHKYTQFKYNIENLRKEYRSDFNKSQRLLSINTSSIQLYEKGEHLLAFEKFIGDILFLKEFDELSVRMDIIPATRKTLPQDRYMLGYARLRNKYANFDLQFRSFYRLIKQASPVVDIKNEEELLTTFNMLPHNDHIY